MPPKRTRSNVSKGGPDNKDKPHVETVIEQDEEENRNSLSDARKEEHRHDPRDLDVAVKEFLDENKDNFLKYLGRRDRRLAGERNDKDEDSSTSPSLKRRRRSPSLPKSQSRRDRRRRRSLSSEEMDMRLEGFERYGRCITPFTNKVLDTHLPDKYKVPNITPYDGLRDPQDFLSQFQYSMINQRLGRIHMCKVFPELLIGNARRWFDSLPPGSIGSYEDLMTTFHRRFFQKTASKVTSAHLLTMRQGQHESILDFMNRFNKECLKVEDISDLLTISAFQNGILPGALYKELVRYKPRTATEL